MFCGAQVPTSKLLLKASWPAVLLASLILLPFLNKAHTIDDTTFLLQAEHVLKDPLHPTAFEMSADGNRIRLSSQLVSGPVMAYLLFPSVLLGGAEWVAHLVQYALVLLAILATVSLALRLGLDVRGARIAGLLLAATPAVMVMATTSMPDVPAMAFAALGLERFFAWKKSRKWHQCLAAATAFALAALSRPHLILILAIAAGAPIAAALKLRRPDERVDSSQLTTGLQVEWSLLLSPILGFILIVFANFLTADPARVGGDFFSVTVSRFRLVNAASNMTAFLLHWVLVFPLALLWVWRGIRWRTLWRNPALWLAAAIVFWIVLRDKNNGVPKPALAIAFCGALVLLDIFVDALRRRDGVQFFLGAWLLVALPAIAYVQLPCKYLVASAPAVAILLARLEAGPRKRSSSAIPVAASACVIFGLLITIADAEFTGIEKRVAQDQVSFRVAQGNRVWVNAEWGFEWYAMKAGAVPVAKQPPFPAPGDVLVSSTAAPHLSLDLFPNRTLLAAIRNASRYGRVMNWPARVGFYSNAYGYFPWTWRNGELDNVTVWLIQ